MNARTPILAPYCWLVLLAATVACPAPPDEEPSDGSGSATEGDSSGDDGATPLACPEPTAGPTRHRDPIVGVERWTADASPHIVETTLRVRDGARLEIEPCAVVQLAEGVALEVAFPGTPTTGELVAEGEAERPIRFEGLEGARWGHIHVHAPGTARFAHVEIDGGGGLDPSGASLIAVGDGVLPSDRGIHVDHVTISGSLGAGIVMSRKAAFADGSSDLVITDSGNSAHPYPIEIDEHALGTLPDGDYTGNLRDEILVDPADALGEDATVRDLGVPYRVGTSSVDRLVVGTGPDSGTLTVLTIEAGVRMKFHEGTSFAIEHATGAFPASGVLVARGTANAPIVLTSAADTPAAGDWVGLWFGGIVDDRSVIRHARIEYTGADCGCVLLTCSDVEGTEGAVILTQPPSSAFVSETVIAHAAGNGIVLGYDGPLLDFEGTNEFEEVAGCRVTLPREGSCPNPLPTCE